MYTAHHTFNPNLFSHEQSTSREENSAQGWLSVDPLADHPNQVDKSPYAAFWNNPIVLTDPDGRCPDCPDPTDANEGDVANPNGTQEYIFTNGQWTGVGGTLNEVTVTAATETTPITPQSNDRLSGQVMNFTLGVSGALLADDVTGIGVMDDPAILVVLVTGTALAGMIYAYEELNPHPRPWYTDKPTSTIPDVEPGVYPGMTPKGGGGGGGPDWLPWATGLGWAGAEYFLHKRREFIENQLRDAQVEQDNTRVVTPELYFESGE